MANQGAESEVKCSYDVFLSFRDEDTRHTFTTDLYNALDQKGIITFMDNEELKAGKRIGPTLEKAIEESRYSIVVFSENYADSTWCLDELVKIHECMVKNDQFVIPIFYQVEPSDVRHQKRSYGEAMTRHETRFGKDSKEVHQWRSALSEIANLSGHPLKGDESEFIKKFVRKNIIRLSPKYLTRNEHIVGRENRVEELKSRLQIESHNITCMLGIHGAPGIGKTTLAKALYDSVYNQKFEGSCFLSNVREISNQIDGLARLQRELLSKTLEVEDNKFPLKGNEDMIRTIKTRLGLKRVLIVLDDVDDIKQLNSLAGERDWFGLGSRIIITTRDKHLLDVAKVENENRYEVNVLNDQESLDLFCHFAFKTSCLEPNYEDLTYRAMRCCKGNPLALKVLGSHLIGKDLGEWEYALDRYGKSPHPEVQKAFRISYDSLPPNEKNIFLDVACFFKGQTLGYVKEVLRACGFHSGDGITTLVNKSLLTVDCNCLGMHDLIQETGRKIVQEEAWSRVGERSRLWFYEDVRQVLEDNIGSSKIQGIMLDPPQREEINCIDTVFEKMKNLRILIVRNTSFTNEPSYLPNNLSLLDWKYYPSHSFPSDFYPWKIGAFNFCGSPLLVLDKAFQTFESLTYMNISNCQMVTEFPDVSGAKNLIELRLDGCKKLVKVHKSVGCLAKLVYLSASECTQLVSFVPTIELPCLEYLSLNFCRSLAHFPNIKQKTDKTLKIHMIDTAIKELPKSIKKLSGLNYLDMTGCTELQDLPSSLLMSTSLVTLKIEGCCRLRESFRRFQGRGQKLETLHFGRVDLLDEDLHAIIQSFPNLKDLIVSWNNFLSLPACITESTNLTSLDLSYCTKLREIPGLPSSVQKVDARHCHSLTSEASDMLWSLAQVSKTMDKLEVKMPKREIPKWFNHVSREGSPVPPIFWARGSFPVVALAFVFGEVNDKGGLPIHWRSVGLRMFIDERSQYQNFILAENHVLLCDLRVLFNLEWKDFDVQGHDWKTIRVHCETEMTLCSWGVYVYKDETNMKDIQFASPGSNFPLVLYLRFPTISEEEKKIQRESLNMGEIGRGYLHEFRRLRDSGFYDDKSPSCLQNDQDLAVMLDRLGRQGEGTSGLNIEDNDRESDWAKSRSDWIRRVISGDKSDSKVL